MGSGTWVEVGGEFAGEVEEAEAVHLCGGCVERWGCSAGLMCMCECGCYSRVGWSGDVVLKSTSISKHPLLAPLKLLSK
jgi:hypothetical protein